MIEDMENNPYQSDLDVEEYYQTAISKLGKQEIDTYHHLSRDAIEHVDLEHLRLGFEGLKYRRFIKELLRRSSCDKLLLKIAGNFAALNPVEREAAKAILRLHDQYALDRKFWHADSGKVLYEICKSFEEMLTAKGCQVEDKIKLTMFRLVSDNLAVIVLHDKELRKIAGIRKGLRYTW
jgi:hypothetical protein